MTPTPHHSHLTGAAAAVPVGAWGVAVSGGADSMALLRALAERTDLTPYALHFNHGLRGAESEADAEFVAEQAAGLGIRSYVGTPGAAVPPAIANPQARYRSDRLAFFKKIVAAQGLLGVVLGHHAGDQAETVLLRLLRASGPLGLGGMAHDATVSGLRLLRPLLDVPADASRAFCRATGQAWREDSSNTTTKYRRNVVRQWLANKPDVAAALLEVGRASAAARARAEAAAPTLPPSFEASLLTTLPNVIARCAARRWLLAHGSRHADVSDAQCDTLIELAGRVVCRQRVRHHFPGAVRVLGRWGMIQTEP